MLRWGHLKIQLLRLNFNHSKRYSNECGKIRNIGIIAHIDAGKTTTTERMLFYAGWTRRIGEVDRGDTVMDYLPEERERGITITAAAIRFTWAGNTFNLIDTPGHVDFGMEVERSLRILDGAVTILDGSAGVQAQTSTVWRQASRFGIPRIIYINKMDKLGADFNRSISEVKEKLYDINPICVQVPILKEDGKIACIADLVNEKILCWTDPQGQSINVLPWEGQHEQQSLLKERNKMLDQLASLDDTFLEKYLDDDPNCKVKPNDVEEAIRRLTIQKKIAPVLCGSSFMNIGVQPVLDAVVKYLPSPFERPSPTIIGKDGRQTVWNPQNNRLLLALAFKVVHDEQRGLMVFVRVYSGILTNRTTLRNSNRGVKERTSRIMIVYANQFEEVEQVAAGNIAVLLGLKVTRTGDTLISESDARIGEVRLVGIQAPKPVFTCAIEAESSSEEARLDEALKIVELEDPSLQISRDPETNQKHLSGMGELHLEIVGKRITRDLKAKAIFGKVQIAYREVILLPSSPMVSTTTLVEGKIDKELSGRRLFASLTFNVENTGVITGSSDTASPTVMFEELKLPAAVVVGLQQVISEGLEAAIQEGPTASFPLVGLQVIVKEVIWTEGLSSLDAFRYVAYSFLRRWISQQKSKLVEPIMSVEIAVPTIHLGNILTDIHSARRGIVVETVTAATVDHQQEMGEHIIRAEIPLASMIGYATSLRSRTAGTATFSMQPLTYRPMSQEEQTRVLAKFGIIVGLEQSVGGGSSVQQQ